MGSLRSIRAGLLKILASLNPALLCLGLAFLSLDPALAAKALSNSKESQPYEIKILPNMQPLRSFRWETLRVEGGGAELVASLNKADWSLTSPDPGVEVKKLEGGNRWRVVLKNEGLLAGFHVAAVGPLGEADVSGFYLEQIKVPVSTLPPVPKVARITLSLTPGFQGGTLSQDGSFGEITGTLKQGAFLSVAGQYLFTRYLSLRLNFARYQTTFEGKGLTYLNQNSVSGTALDIYGLWKQFEVGFSTRPQAFVLAQPSGVTIVMGSARSARAGLRQVRGLKIGSGQWVLQTAERLGYVIGGTAGEGLQLQSLKGFNVEASAALLRSIRRSPNWNLSAGLELNGGWQSLKGSGEWTSDFNGPLSTSSLLYGGRVVITATF